MICDGIKQHRCGQKNYKMNSTIGFKLENQESNADNLHKIMVYNKRHHQANLQESFPRTMQILYSLYLRLFFAVLLNRLLVVYYLLHPSVRQMVRCSVYFFLFDSSIGFLRRMTVRNTFFSKTKLMIQKTSKIVHKSSF